MAAWVQAAGLTLHPTKTRIVNATGKGGFDFLGYHFEQYREGGGKKWPRQKSRHKLRERLREKLPRHRSGSVAEIVTEVNRTLKGWYGYFNTEFTYRVPLTEILSRYETDPGCTRLTVPALAANKGDHLARDHGSVADVAAHSAAAAQSLGRPGQL
jgi:hypothetical protein